MENMDYNAVLKQVKSSLDGLTNTKLSEIREENKITTELGLDSLSTIELILNLEERYKIEIPDDYSDKFSYLSEGNLCSREKQDNPITVKNLTNYVLGLVNESYKTKS